MKRYTNNGKSVWGQNRNDSYPVNRFGGRPPFGGRRDGSGNYRSSGDDSDIEGRTMEETHHDDHVSNKLDRVLEKLDQFDVWREETDRKFETLAPAITRDSDVPLGFDDGDEPQCDDNRRRRPVEKGFQPRNPNLGFQEEPRREERGRIGHGWEFLGERHNNFVRPATCWDPPHRYKSHVAGYEKPQRVKMHPPRFNGADATN